MKKLLCAILTLLMIVTAAIPAFAAVTQNTVGYSAKNVKVDENFDSATDIEELEVSETDGYDSVLGFNTKLLADTTYFYIDSVAGMKLFAKIVSCGNNTNPALNGYCFLGKTVYLSQDIDFSNVTDMYPIGQPTRNETNGTQINKLNEATTYFSGTFDGRGYSIKNLDMTAKYASDATYGDFGNGVALFYMIRGNAVLRNLVIDADSSFINTCSMADSTNLAWSGRNNVAASLVAYAQTYYGDGYDSDGFTVENIISYATVASSPATTVRDYRYNIVGGLIAVVDAFQSATTIRNCTFSGTIDTSCYTSQYKNDRKGYAAGGIVGEVYRATANGALSFDRCINLGEIDGASYTGGIVGGAASTDQNLVVTFSISNCINDGSVSYRGVGTNLNTSVTGAAGAFFGGILDNGNYDSSRTCTIENCINKYTGLTEFVGLKTGTVNDTNNNVNVSSLNGEAGTDTLVRYEGLQIKKGTTQSVRFIGCLMATEEELANYDKVGFKITAMYGDSARQVDANGQEVYTSLNGTTADGWDIVYSAKDGEYFIAVTLEGLSPALGEVTFVVTPYCVSGDTTTYGAAKTTTIDMATGEKA